MIGVSHISGLRQWSVMLNVIMMPKSFCGTNPLSMNVVLLDSIKNNFCYQCLETAFSEFCNVSKPHLTIFIYMGINTRNVTSFAPLPWSLDYEILVVIAFFSI